VPIIIFIYYIHTNIYEPIVTELREALSKRGLPTDGLKAVLLSRLQEHMENNAPSMEIDEPAVEETAKEEPAEEEEPVVNEPVVNEPVVNEPIAEEPVAYPPPEEEEEPPSTPKKKTIIQKEMKEEVVSISYALQALKVIFNSLTQSKGGTASTSVLCRTLGINPYLQQDGQEFWKLFVPELNNDELTSLYSGYFEDYVREIIPEEEEDGEEKKDDDDEPQAVASEEGTARERIRTEPFLDLSIPVAEGTG